MFKEKRKVVFSLLMAGALTLSISACGQKAPEPVGTAKSDTQNATTTAQAKPNVKGKITIVTQTVEYKDLLQKFNKDYPDVELTWDQDANAPDTQKVRLSAGGERIDLLTPGKADYPVMAAAGQLLDLTDKSFLSNYYPEAIDSAKVSGKVFGVPMTQQVYMVWYNKDIFKKYNLSEPKDWDEFMKICDTLKANNVSPIVAAGKNFPFFEAAMTYNSIVSKDNEWYRKVKTGDVKWTDSDSINSLKQFADLFANGYVLDGALSTDDVQAYQAFYQGKAAMLPNGAWSVDKVKQATPTFALGAFPYPSAKGTDNKVQATYGSTFSVAASSENKDAAVAFIDWMSKPENAQVYSDVAAIYSSVKGTTAKFHDAAKLLNPIFEMPKTYMMHAEWSPSVNAIFNMELQKLIDAKSTKATPESIAKEIQNAQDKDIKK